MRARGPSALRTLWAMIVLALLILVELLLNLVYLWGASRSRWLRPAVGAKVIALLDV